MAQLESSLELLPCSTQIVLVQVQPASVVGNSDMPRLWKDIFFYLLSPLNEGEVALAIVEVVQGERNLDCTEYKKVGCEFAIVWGVPLTMD